MSAAGGTYKKKDWRFYRLRIVPLLLNHMIVNSLIMIDVFAAVCVIGDASRHTNDQSL